MNKTINIYLKISLSLCHVYDNINWSALAHKIVCHINYAYTDLAQDIIKGFFFSTVVSRKHDRILQWKFAIVWAIASKTRWYGGTRRNEVAGQFLGPSGVATSCKRQPIGHPIWTHSGETGSVTFYREKYNFAKMLPLRGKLISAEVQDIVYFWLKIV